MSCLTRWTEVKLKLVALTQLACVVPVSVICNVNVCVPDHRTHVSLYVHVCVCALAALCDCVHVSLPPLCTTQSGVRLASASATTFASLS